MARTHRALLQVGSTGAASIPTAPSSRLATVAASYEASLDPSGVLPQLVAAVRQLTVAHNRKGKGRGWGGGDGGRRPGAPSTGGPKLRGVCFSCGKPGHFARDCRNTDQVFYAVSGFKGGNGDNRQIVKAMISDSPGRPIFRQFSSFRTFLTGSSLSSGSKTFKKCRRERRQKRSSPILKTQ
jgi:hypothetical protein